MTRKTAQHGGVIGWSSATDETNYACVRAFERGVGHEGAVRNSQARIDRARPRWSPKGAKPPLTDSAPLPRAPSRCEQPCTARSSQCRLRSAHHSDAAIYAHQGSTSPNIAAASAGNPSAIATSPKATASIMIDSPSSCCREVPAHHLRSRMSKPGFGRCDADH